jgi:pimeloyl-ACP methyl ester carboxylesterase
MAPQWYIDDRVRDGAGISANVWRDTFKGLITARPPTDARTIAAPTLIIWGDRDEFLTQEQEEALAAAMPVSRLVMYEDTAHLVPWEQPERRVASDLITFVEGLHSGMRDEP